MPIATIVLALAMGNTSYRFPPYMKETIVREDVLPLPPIVLHLFLSLTNSFRRKRCSIRFAKGLVAGERRSWQQLLRSILCVSRPFVVQ
jgi:hypothetical protein